MLSSTSIHFYKLEIIQLSCVYNSKKKKQIEMIDTIASVLVLLSQCVCVGMRATCVYVLVLL